MNKRDIIIHDGKYRLLNKLGSGRFSSCWEAEIVTEESKPVMLCKENVAIKIQRNKKNYLDMARDEIKFYEIMKNSGKKCDNVLTLQEHFTEQGGDICMVFEKMDQTLLKFIEKSKTGLSWEQTRDISKQLLNGVIFLHKNGIVHTDIKPENVLVKELPDGKLRVCISDLGNAVLASELKRYFKLNKQEFVQRYDELLDNPKVERYNELMELEKKSDKEENELKRLSKQKEVINFRRLDREDEIKEYKDLNEKIGDSIGTTEYHSIESIIGAEYSSATDLWSVACVIFECLTNNYLFDPHSYCNDNMNEDDDDDDDNISISESSSSGSESDDEENRLLIDQMHLWLITRTLGDIPRYVSRQGDFADDFFNRAGNIKNMPGHLKKKSISYTLTYDYNFDDNTAKEIETLLLPMLIYDPEKRIRAIDVLDMF